MDKFMTRGLVSGLAGILIFFLPHMLMADADSTLQWLLNGTAPALQSLEPTSIENTAIIDPTAPPEPALLDNGVIPSSSISQVPMATERDKPVDQCQQLLEENGLSPNDTVWYAENPSGQIVEIKAQEACSLCVVGNGQPAWKCTPVDPEGPPDGGGITPPIGVIPPGGVVTPPIGVIPPGGVVTPPIAVIPPGGGGGVEVMPPIAILPPGSIEIVPPIGILPPDGGGETGGGTGGGGTEGGGETGGGGTEGGGTEGGGTEGGGTEGGGGETGGGETGGGETDGGGSLAGNLVPPNVSQEQAIKNFSRWFLPRNVDAQPRAITGYGVNLFHALSRVECSDLPDRSSIWATSLYNHEGEGSGELLWNDYQSSSVGLAAGTCIKTDSDNKYGLMVHFGKTSLDHDSEFPGTYDADNFGAGVFYIDQNENNRLTGSLVVTRHYGEQERTLQYFAQNTLRSEGDRDATSAYFSFGYERTKRDWLLQPFGLATLSYVHQGNLDEKGFPLFTLRFDSRDTWWLNLEGGFKYEKLFEVDDEIDYRLLAAGVLTFLTNISDENQRFTYYRGRTLEIGGSGQNEAGFAVRLGLSRRPKDPDKMRIELEGSTGYQAEVVTYSALLNLVFPFGD